MKVLRAGHRYVLTHRGGRGSSLLHFVNREPGQEEDGPLTQEALRALIDRTAYCHACLPSEHNAAIIYHLRMALAHHEARALVRKAHKGLYKPEEIVVGADGHFILPRQAPDGAVTPFPAVDGRRLGEAEPTYTETPTEVP